MDNKYTLNQDKIDLTKKFLSRVEFRGTSAIELARLLNLCTNLELLKQHLDAKTLELLIKGLESSYGVGLESIEWVDLYTTYIAIYEDLQFNLENE